MWNFTKDYLLVKMLVVISIAVNVHSASMNESASKMLSEHLSNNYGSTAIRPVKNPSETVVVTFRVLVAQVIEFDERKQHILLNGWRRQDWRDEFLQWNPEEYGGLQRITYGKEKIWIPDITLLENVGLNFIEEFDTDVFVRYDGLVQWYSPVIVDSACRVDVRFFPFDTQTCTMTYISWSYDSNGIYLQIHIEEYDDQDVFLQNGVWSLRNVVGGQKNVTYACCETPYTQIVYNLTLERAYGFYVLNIVLPSGLLAFVNCLVFLMPPESGERLQFAVSNLLAAILFQQLIGGIMPPLGDELPLLGMFFVYMILTNCFVLAMSIGILRFYHQRGDKVVPKVLRQICFMKRTNENLLKRHPNLKNNVFTVEAPFTDFSSETKLDSLPPSPSQNGESLRQRHNSCDINDVRSETANRASPWERRTSISTRTMLERNKNEWQQVTRILDNYLFLFIVSVTVVVVVAIVVLFCTR